MCRFANENLLSRLSGPYIYIFKHLSPGLCDNTPVYCPIFNLKSKAQTLINKMFNIQKKSRERNHIKD